MNDFFTTFSQTFIPENPRYFLITDGQGTIVIKWIQLYSYRNALVRLYPARNGPTSFRHTLCLLLCQMPHSTNAPTMFNPLPWRKCFHGALNMQAQSDEAISPPDTPSRFRDFDRYTMQRNPSDLKVFLDWKDAESNRLSECHVIPGTIFTVDVKALEHDETLWRSKFPYQPIPPSTKAYVGRNPRLRSNAIDKLLASGQSLNFRVTEVVRHQPDTFSQVFFGVLCSSGGDVSPPVCLKLLVEPMFPVHHDLLWDDFEEEEPPFRLRSLHYAEDMIRREEAAYDRLREHQGTLIPHCYGFHRFATEGSVNGYGVLLEIITGPSLLKAEPWTWTAETQRPFIHHLRECQRALLYAGVDQGDYHGDQILLPDGPNYQPDTDSLVFIDFAFAFQRFGDEQLPGIAATLINKGGITFQPPPTLYQKHVAAFRFKPYPHYNSPQTTVVEKYVNPVLDIFHTYLVGPDDSARFTSKHETLPDRDCVRIHKVDGDEKELHTVLHFLSPGRICWDGILPPRDAVHCSVTSDFLEHFQLTFLSQRPRYFLITDGHGIIVLTSMEHWRNTLRLAEVWLFPASNGVNSLRHTLCLLLCQMPRATDYPAIFNPHPWLKLFHGALNVQKEPEQPICPPLKPLQLEDFDRYTMQRSLPDLREFLNWKEKEAARFSERPVIPGTSFTIDINAFQHEEKEWRCCFPNQPIPARTKDFVGRYPRPRSITIDQLFDSQQGLTFQVTDIIRHKPNTFSQVFFGVLCSSDGTVSPKICLKLFVGAMFPVDEDDLLDDFVTTQPPFRLGSLNYPEDLVRREEAAYKRLQKHQGTLIPHCYGFHQFTMQGSLNAYGVLLEAIPGSSLAQVDPLKWELGVQQSFMCHLRECQRALLYAGVDQRDYHGSQILLPDGPEYRPETDSIVLIDFAFAVQRFGDEQLPNIAATLMGQGIGELMTLLKHICHPQATMKTAFREFARRSMHIQEW
ncbi:hypothetical protein MIND_00960500 [Mycena indigotica]|uniref:Uncharacterized protein n=1 Tax=Mycena indigotica TaxID=2126181 RepID=A0A8H6W0N8_9AGAR|nr:uncharacterized protein MIND_00960500 [Mycena indigotica]KAF7297273.1 hypothetical protein MIND_00960500 [Mycena indigotica]